MSTSLPSAMKAALENIEPDDEAFSYDTCTHRGVQMHRAVQPWLYKLAAWAHWVAAQRRGGLAHSIA